MCYPSYWTESGVPAPVESWFNKYVVAEVTEKNTYGGNPDMVTQYSYTVTTTQVDDLTYSYDNTGQLTEVSDQPSGDTTADDTQCSPLRPPLRHRTGKLTFTTTRTTSPARFPPPPAATPPPPP
jgi:hypothetical protein